MYEITRRTDREEDDFFRAITLLALTGGLQAGGTPSSGTPSSGGAPGINIESLASTAVLAGAFSHDLGAHDILLPLLVASGTIQIGGAQPNLLPLFLSLHRPSSRRYRREAFYEPGGGQSRTARDVRAQINDLIAQLRDAGDRLTRIEQALEGWPGGARAAGASPDHEDED